MSSRPIGKAVGKLLRVGLIEEIPAGGALPVWRRDDDARTLGLRITPHGLTAIGVEAGVAERKSPQAEMAHSQFALCAPGCYDRGNGRNKFVKKWRFY